MTDLKSKIIGEMTSNYSNSLERCFEDAKYLFKLSPTGIVEVLNKDKYLATEQIQIYLLGKAYAKEAQYCEASSVSMKELMEELGKPEGTIKSSLKTLRDSNKVKTNKTGGSAAYYIPANLIEKAIKDLKVNKGDINGN